MTRMHADNALEWSSMVEFPLTAEQVRSAAVTICRHAVDAAGDVRAGWAVSRQREAWAVHWARRFWWWRLRRDAAWARRRAGL